MKTNKPATAASSKGFTLIEMIFVLAIIGVMIIASFPSFTNSSETRALDAAANDVLTSIQMAKFKAASLKQSHRVHFTSVSGAWTIWIDRESASGTWTAMTGWIGKRLSNRFNVTLSLPSTSDVIFMPTGFVSNYDGTKNTITIVSPKMTAVSLPGQRTIRILAGGSVQYTKS